MKLPSFLRRTPAQLEAERDRQEKAKEHFAARRRDPVLHRLHHAVLSEEAIRKNLATMTNRSPAYVETLNQLAEVVAEQGRFAEAAKIARDPDMIAEYKSHAGAEAEGCECPPRVHQRVVDGRPVNEEIAPHFVLRQVFDDNGKVVDLMRCGRCDHTFIK